MFNNSGDIDNSVKLSRYQISNQDAILYPTMNSNPPSYEDSCLDEQVHRKPLGLNNSQSYCYMNCVIQALRHLDLFTVKLQIYQPSEDNGPIETQIERCRLLLTKFRRVLHCLQNREETELNKALEEFQKVHECFPTFSEGEQDADEYLQFLLNAFNDAIKPPNQIKSKKKGGGGGCLTKTKIKPTPEEEAFQVFYSENNSFVTDIFCGQMNNKIRCNKCGFQKSQYQIFWVLALPIVNSPNSSDDSSIKLSQCLSALFSSQLMDKAVCTNCHSCNTMTTQTIITHWPKCLIIHVKRQVNPLSNAVIDSPIEFNVDSCLMINESQYELVGVIDRKGSMDSGHYYGKFVEVGPTNEKIWWLFNDKIVYSIVNRFSNIITGNTLTYFFSNTASRCFSAL